MVFALIDVPNCVAVFYAFAKFLALKKHKRYFVRALIWNLFVQLHFRFDAYHSRILLDFYNKTKVYKMSSEEVNTKENPRCFFDVTIGGKSGIYKKSEI